MYEILITQPTELCSLKFTLSLSTAKCFRGCAVSNNTTFGKTFYNL